MINILVAEDEAATRKMISLYLQKKGFRVLEAANGIEAFTAIMEHPVNLAIVDWILPGMDGLEVCRKIRDKQKSTYVFIIMLTSKGEQEDMIQGFEAGVDEYIPKPVNLQELMARIKVGVRIISLEQELVEKQHELAGTNEMKNKFIGIVAHDLRNPVISIRGFSELLLKDAKSLSEEQTEFLHIIHSTSRNMLAMINDLLDISHIESGMHLSLAKGSLNALILDRIQMNRLQADKKHITIHKQLSVIPDVSFDSQRMGQSIDNLISNAVKFSPIGSNIYIALDQDGELIRFSVTDEGPGIPREEQHLLFSEFHRLSIRPTAGETSTGLGLAITKKIIEAHNGSVEVETREGMGSTFRIILPVA